MGEQDLAVDVRSAASPALDRLPQCGVAIAWPRTVIQPARAAPEFLAIGGDQVGGGFVAQGLGAGLAEPAARVGGFQATQSMVAVNTLRGDRATRSSWCVETT